MLLSFEASSVSSCPLDSNIACPLLLLLCRHLCFASWSIVEQLLSLATTSFGIRLLQLQLIQHNLICNESSDLLIQYFKTSRTSNTCLATPHSLQSTSELKEEESSSRYSSPCQQLQLTGSSTHRHGEQIFTHVRPVSGYEC